MARSRLKRLLAPLGQLGRPAGTTLLIYHRIGSATVDELEVRPEQFAEQMDALGDSATDVVSLDAGLDRLSEGDSSPAAVLTFDDGFSDVYEVAWPLLSERGWPFTVYLATAYAGGNMRWEGATGDASGHGLTWDQLAEMSASGLCTVANHTHTHCPPERLTASELDRCSDAIEGRLGTRPRHFAFPWGVDVPAMRAQLAERFRSAATGKVGRNGPGADLMALRRVPVRRSDPIGFFRAKVDGGLLPERAYGGAVAAAKAMSKARRRG